MLPRSGLGSQTGSSLKGNLSGWPSLLSPEVVVSAWSWNALRESLRTGICNKQFQLFMSQEVACSSVWIVPLSCHCIVLTVPKYVYRELKRYFSFHHLFSPFFAITPYTGHSLRSRESCLAKPHNPSFMRLYSARLYIATLYWHFQWVDSSVRARDEKRIKYICSVCLEEIGLLDWPPWARWSCLWR